MATQGNFIQCRDGQLEASENDSTSFIISMDKDNTIDDYDDRCNITTTKIQNITLLQEPSESLDFQLIVRDDEDYCCYNTYFNPYPNPFDLDINFANCIHKSSQDYGYIVQIQALTKESDNRTIHVNLFSHEEIRRTNKISLQNVRIPESKWQSKNIIHYCCCIRRFNSVTSTIRHVSFSNDLVMKMLNDGIYSDVALIVGDKTFKAHKYILSLQSDVFKAMFSYNMAENDSCMVKIDDFDAQVIENMLQYIYTCTTPNLPKLALELFKVAHKYEIHGLKFKCEEYLIFNLNRQNVIDILELARIYDLKSVKNVATSFVHSHEADMVKEGSYQKFLCRDLSVSTVASTLLLCDEYDLEDVRSLVFDFVKNNKKSIISNKEFLDLFNSNGDLMKQLFIHLCL